MNAYQIITEETMNQLGAALSLAKQLIIEAGYHTGGEPNSSRTIINKQIDEALDDWRIHRNLLQEKAQ